MNFEKVKGWVSGCRSTVQYRLQWVTVKWMTWRRFISVDILYYIIYIVITYYEYGRRYVKLIL